VHLGWFQVSGLAADVGSVVVGLALLAVMPPLVRGLVSFDRRLTRSLLGEK
jgi:hypothetical protein